MCGLLAIGAIASVISNKRRDAALAVADASALTGGGSSGLTFEAFSAENDGGEGGGGGGFTDAAAAALTGGEEITPPAVSAIQSAAEEELAGAQDQAIAASKAAEDAAVATAGDAADDAAAAVEAGAAALAEGAAPVKRGLMKGAAFGMEPAKKTGEDAGANKQGLSPDGVVEGMAGEDGA